LTRPGVAKNQSITFGKLLNCPTDNSAAMVSCLKTKSVNDIIGTLCDQLSPTCALREFLPVIEPVHPGAYIAEEPEKSIRAGNFADVPLMTGINAQEGCGIVSSILGRPDQQYAKMLDENFLELGPKALGYDVTCPAEYITNVTKSIRKFYFGDKKIDVSTKWNLIDMYTDAWFLIGGHTTIKSHLEKLSSRVYYYFFDYKGTSSYSAIFGDPVNNYGVCHSDELQYLFPVGGLLFPNATMNAEDLKVIDVMTTLWANFAKSGNPTPDYSRRIPVNWTPVTTPSLQYLHIKNSSNLFMARDLFPERIRFWDSLPYRALIA